MFNDIVIIDDLISPLYQDKVEELFTSGFFDWNYGPASVYEVNGYNPQSIVDHKTIDSFQFTHLFYHQQASKAGVSEGKFYDFIKPLIYTAVDRFQIQNSTLGRLKANMLTNNRKYDPAFYNTPHVDLPLNHMVVIYYVNDSDGDTVIFNETFGTKFEEFTVKQRITPKKGRAIMFPGKYFHCSTNPIENDVRVVINVDLLLPPDNNKTIIL